MLQQNHHFVENSQNSSLGKVCNVWLVWHHICYTNQRYRPRPLIALYGILSVQHRGISVHIVYICSDKVIYGIGLAQCTYMWYNGSRRGMVYVRMVCTYLYSIQ